MINRFGKIATNNMVSIGKSNSLPCGAQITDNKYNIPYNIAGTIIPITTPTTIVSFFKIFAIFYFLSFQDLSSSNDSKAVKFVFTGIIET